MEDSKRRRIGRKKRDRDFPDTKTHRREKIPV
jgi:hypothetical protein